MIYLKAIWWYNKSVCFVPDSGIAQTLKKEELFLYEIGGNIGKHIFFSLYSYADLTLSLVITYIFGAGEISGGLISIVDW